MRLTVNRTEMDVPDGLSVAGLITLLRERSFDVLTLDDVFMITLNGEYLEPESYADTLLRSGDLIELFPLSTGG